MYCTRRLAGNAGRKKSPKNRRLGIITQLCRAISSQLRHVSTIGKNLLNSNVSPTCPPNIVNFGPLEAETCWIVWGTPAHFNGFRVLAALLHGTRRQPNFAALNRGRHLYSAGRLSHWALAHILVLNVFSRCFECTETYKKLYITVLKILKFRIRLVMCPGPRWMS